MKERYFLVLVRGTG